ncbi:MAG: YbjN domain-containing protein [Nitriliruptoraceae bacterium]
MTGSTDDETSEEPTEEQSPDGEDHEDHDDRNAALARLTATASLPRPPRRTGVMLDPEELRDHISGLLRAMLGGHEVDAFGNITFTHEGARVFVTVAGSPVGPQVGVFSVTNLDVDLTEELGRFLLTTNHTLGFGAFSYDPENRAVWLRHTLLGSMLDLPELQTAVLAIATTAAQLDHTIQERFGGRTFQDAPSDVQRKVEPPEAGPGSPPPNAGGYL